MVGFTPGVRRERFWLKNQRGGRHKKRYITVCSVAGSSNGRTLDSGSSNRGSSPCPAALLRVDLGSVV